MPDIRIGLADLAFDDIAFGIDAFEPDIIAPQAHDVLEHFAGGFSQRHAI